MIKSEEYKEKSYDISNATALQADESDRSTTLLAYSDDARDDLIKAYLPDTTDAVKDEYVSIKGNLESRENYDTQSGGSNAVPTIVAYEVSVTGKAAS